MRAIHLSDIVAPRWFALVSSLLVAVAIATIAASPGSASAAIGCTPFGDPPQTLISDPVPTCLSGTLLGPWYDSNGTPRYACLYEPASASPSNRLPLLVWVHPSLVTADSITSTNILEFQNDFSLAAGTTGFVVLTPE